VAVLAVAQNVDVSINLLNDNKFLLIVQVISKAPLEVAVFKKLNPVTDTLA
jgi:hypothetical protein